ncbi:MAG: hypothetical protein IJA10_10360 [Lachnospiraceae bacterium]|nr:hypothetical protein [Lachnospiraceae bacterium]
MEEQKDILKSTHSSTTSTQPKRKRGRPPKNKVENQQSEKKSYEIESRPTEQLVKDNNEKNNSKINYSSRTRMVNFEQYKELLLQNVSKNKSKNFIQYTKALIKQYLQNPLQNKDKIRNLSRYLFRASTLYRKIILYYACMPLYNYYVTEKIDLTKSYNATKSMKSYNAIIQKLQLINFKSDFAQIIALAVLDGAYYGFVYDNGDKGLFFHALDPQYCKIKGKNEAGQWLIGFDMSYFSQGSNSEFVDGINGDTTGCWDDVFVNAWKEYQSDKQNKRWAILPPERTICLLAGLDDEFDLPLPFFLGIYTLLMDCEDYTNIMANKTALENYKLLVSKIPMMDGDNIDDFKLSLELTEVFQDMIDEILPENVGAVRSPMDLDVVNFEKSNTTSDTDMLSKSIKNVFDNCGASQLVVSGGSSTNSIGLKQSIANDSSLTFLWVARLESNFNYWLSQNGYDGFMLQFHRQTWYNREDYIKEIKESATLGNNPLLYLTALGQTPYEVECGLRMSMNSGIRDLLIPLKTTYTDQSNGKEEKSDSEISDAGIETRDKGKNEGTKANG